MHRCAVLWVDGRGWRAKLSLGFAIKSQIRTIASHFLVFTKKLVPNSLEKNHRLTSYSPVHLLSFVVLYDWQTSCPRPLVLLLIGVHLVLLRVNPMSQALANEGGRIIMWLQCEPMWMWFCVLIQWRARLM